VGKRLSTMTRISSVAVAKFKDLKPNIPLTWSQIDMHQIIVDFMY